MGTPPRERHHNVTIWTNGHMGSEPVMELCRLLRFVDANYSIDDVEMVNDYHALIKIDIISYSREQASLVDNIIRRKAK